jgi:hypothetical protein
MSRETADLDSFLAPTSREQRSLVLYSGPQTQYLVSSSHLAIPSKAGQMAKRRNSRSVLPIRKLGSPPSKPVEDRVRGPRKLDDNRSTRAGSSAADGAFERSRAVAAKKSKVGVTYVLNESIDDALLKRDERHTWSRNGLVPRSKLRLTKRQQKAVQTPSYMR